MQRLTYLLVRNGGTTWGIWRVTGAGCSTCKDL